MRIIKKYRNYIYAFLLGEVTVFIFVAALLLLEGYPILKNLDEIFRGFAVVHLAIFFMAVFMGLITLIVHFISKGISNEKN